MKLYTILLLSLLTISCNQETTEEKEAAEQTTNSNELILSSEQLNTFQLTAVGLEEKEISGALRLTGKVGLQPNARISLSSALGGRIKSINALPGKQVKRGEVLFTIEDQKFVQLQQDYLTTQAQLLSALPDFKRQQELNRNKSASDKAMQQAETEYRTLLAMESGLQEQLRLIHINPATVSPQNIRSSIHIVAPADGVIAQVYVNNGKYVSPSDELAELIDQKGLLVYLKVFERDLPKIKAGQPIKLYSNSSPDLKVDAKILTKANNISDDGSAEVIAIFTGSKPVDFADGTFVNAEVAVDNLVSYTLPSEAVVSFGGKTYVFLQSDQNRFLLQEVETSESSDSLIAIINYENLLNKKIVSKGAYNLLVALKNEAEE